MSGRPEGGIKAAETNKKLYGDKFYQEIGAKGGKKSRNGGFGSQKVGADGLTGKERAAIAGKKGGSTKRLLPIPEQN